jgi:hypothetical protein
MYGNLCNLCKPPNVIIFVQTINDNINRMIILTCYFYLVVFISKREECNVIAYSG